MTDTITINKAGFIDFEDMKSEVDSVINNCTGISIIRGVVTIETSETLDAGDLSAVTNAVTNYQDQAILTAKRNLKRKINKVRDRHVEDGFDHEISGQTYRFDSDKRSAIRVGGVYSSGILALLSASPFSQLFRDKHNNNHLLDAQGAIDFFESGATSESDIVFKAVDIKAQIDAKVYNSVEEVLAEDPQELWDNYVPTP